MKEVMSKYAQSKGVKADRLSWKRRSEKKEAVTIAGTVPGRPEKQLGAEQGECGYSVRPAFWASSEFGL